MDAFSNFKLFPQGVGGQEADGMICTEKCVIGKETVDCVICGEAAAEGFKNLYTALSFYIVCVYIFSIIHGLSKKMYTFQSKTTNKGNYIMKFGRDFKSRYSDLYMNTPLESKIL